jgi:hypothetical protein
MLSILLDIKGIGHNEFVLAGQSIPYTALTFYGYCVKMCQDFARTSATKELAVASRQHTVSHFFFRHGILTINKMTATSHPPYSPDLAPLRYSVSPNENTAILTHLG